MKSSDCVFDLETVSVAFSTSDGLHMVLKDIDFKVRQGDWIAIVGKNGSGKSTLTKVLTGLCPISRGTMHTRDQTLVQLVFQDPDAQIVGETVYEEICFGMENQCFDPVDMPKQVQNVLQQIGLNVQIDRPVSTLSGGQKQLLNIASCLAVHASVLIFDEATAMLSPMARGKILDVVHNLHQQGVTVIWVTQWMNELSYAQKVIVLEQGNIAFRGSCQDFFYPESSESGSSPCEQLGFSPPYAIQVARNLLRNGYSLVNLPTCTEELMQAVKASWQ